MSEEAKVGIKRKHEYVLITDKIIDDETVSRAELLVYVALCRFANKADTAYPSVKAIAVKARLKSSTVSVAIKGLEEKGYLERDIIPGRTPHYTILERPKPQKKQAPDKVPIQKMDDPIQKMDDTHPKIGPEVSYSEVDIDKKGERPTIFATLSQIHEQRTGGVPLEIPTDIKPKLITAAQHMGLQDLLDCYRLSLEAGKPIRFFLEDLAGYLDTVRGKTPAIVAAEDIDWKAFHRERGESEQAERDKKKTAAALQSGELPSAVPGIPA